MPTHCNMKNYKVGKVLSCAIAVMIRKRPWRVNEDEKV
jgi:hypothetical protein